MKHFIDFAYRNQKGVLGLAIFLAFLSVSFQFDGGSVSLVWRSYPFVAVLILCLALTFIWLYVYLVQREMQKLRQEIATKGERNAFENNLIELTDRQREIYDFIIQGMTNKQIMEELFIELSTLKTHINHIYKKLNVESRKALKNQAFRNSK